MPTSNAEQGERTSNDVQAGVDRSCENACLKKRYADASNRSNEEIAACSVILPGGKIGLSSIVGANSTVTRDTSSGVVAGRAPARVLKRRGVEGVRACLQGSEPSLG